MTTLHDAYISGDPAVRELFNGAPESVFTQPTNKVAWPDGMAQALNAYQRGIGTTQAPVAGNEWVVATGQQPGVFTGPLYTIYKAITAVKLASQMATTGVPCVPVFWNAGDDHDFEEARVAHFITRRHDIFTARHTPLDDMGNALDVTDLPMYRVPLDAQVHGLVDAIADKCPGSEHGPEIRAMLHETLNAAHSVAEWFSLVMARLFGATTLRLFVPHIHAARLAAVPVLQREISEPLASTRLLQAQGERIEALGYERPIHREEGACNFFLEVGGRRRKVLHQHGRFVIPAEELSCTVEELLALLNVAPERFSPNVALRPVVQQQLFPVAAYVAGPGEVAYWAQLKTVFDFFETPMPIVYPRIRCALHTIKTRKIMRHYGLDVETIGRNEDLLGRALQQDGRNPASEALDANRYGFERSLDALTHAVENTSNNQAFTEAARRFRRKSLQGLAKLERELLHGDTQKRAAVEKRIERLRIAVAPLGKPQERVVSVFSFLFAHGIPLIERMINELDAQETSLQEMEL